MEEGENSNKKLKKKWWQNDSFAYDDTTYLITKLQILPGT